MRAPDSYLGTCHLALEYGETAFMFYTGAPQNTRRVPLSRLKIKEGRSFLADHAFPESKIVVHAPYIVNLAARSDPLSAEAAVSFLVDEFRRVAGFGLTTLVLHPGSATGETPQEGIRNVARGLDEVLERDGTNVRIALETMAGKGHEIGRNFKEIAQIISLSKNQGRIGVCLDTCHLNDAGEDVKDLDGLLTSFEETFGLRKLLVIHLNDSKNQRGSHKDRHENIGYGTIGFSTLEKWVGDPRLADVPKILETPPANSIQTYKKEIAMLRSGIYDPKWRDRFL